VFVETTTTIHIIHFPSLVADRGGLLHVAGDGACAEFHPSPSREHLMKKLRLDLDELTVTTFATDAVEAEAAGTVQANDATVVFGPTRANTCQTCYTNCLPNC
jgi:hypothetical protein